MPIYQCSSSVITRSNSPRQVLVEADAEAPKETNLACTSSCVAEGNSVCPAAVAVAWDLLVEAAADTADPATNSFAAVAEVVGQ